MSFLTVEQQKCVGCGKCANVCPIGTVVMQEGKPEAHSKRPCISCGHCVAVCASGALNNTYAPIDKQIPLSETRPLETKTAYHFLRARRSVRCYKKEQVPQEKILALLDIARFAPTGANTQGVSYLVISDKHKLVQLTNIAVEWMEQEIKRNSQMGKYFEEALRSFRDTGYDIILRDAPHLIIGMTAQEFARGRENTQFALTYVELFAPSLGLGTCWAGLLEACAFSGDKQLLEILDIPDKKKFTGALMAGYPKYQYHRLADRNPLEVIWK